MSHRKDELSEPGIEDTQRIVEGAKIEKNIDLFNHTPEKGGDTCLSTPLEGVSPRELVVRS